MGDQSGRLLVAGELSLGFRFFVFLATRFGVLLVFDLGFEFVLSLCFLLVVTLLVAGRFRVTHTRTMVVRTLRRSCGMAAG